MLLPTLPEPPPPTWYIVFWVDTKTRAVLGAEILTTDNPSIIGNRFAVPLHIYSWPTQEAATKFLRDGHMLDWVGPYHDNGTRQWRGGPW